MVMKSVLGREKHGLQMKPTGQVCGSDRSSFKVEITPILPRDYSFAFRGSEKRHRQLQRRLTNLPTIASLIVISLFMNVLLLGASADSTLADDLLTNSNESHSNHENSKKLASVNTFNVSQPIDSEKETLQTTILPTNIADRNRTNPNVNDSSIDVNDRQIGTGENVNFTLPINATADSKVIIKHGSIFYEVVSNGTIPENYGTFSVPFVAHHAGTRRNSAKSLTKDLRMELFEKMTATVFGLRVEETAKGVSYENGASKILANSKAVIRFFGFNFTSNTLVRFVTEKGERGTDCDDVKSTNLFPFDGESISNNSAVTTVTIPPLNEGDSKYYVCIKEDDIDMPWVHQGPEQWIVIETYQKWLPIWVHILILLVLLVLSGLFSGLNLGLMAIDRTELKIIINAGSDVERGYAKKIQPLRDNGNYLLCSLLLGNVLVNATLTILLDDLTSGIVAVIGSTVGIVIFGEIVPQAVCSRHGLAVGANTVWITKFFMAVTFPLSFPISVILNKVLGEELGNVYNRARLKELIRVTQGENDLEKDEVNIISGALDLKQKTVANVMTRLEEVYMLPIDAVLDFDTVSEIMSNGYSRIPVYENTRGNVVSLLYAKDLAFVDPDDKMPLRAICEFYSNPCHFVFENVTLNVLFNVFKQGNKGHMAFVQRVKSNDRSDPMYEVVGLVTMEDVIEELIQEEINDETDCWESDNKRRSQGNYSAITDVGMPRLKIEGTTVSPQLTLAAFQYLSTAVEEFQDSIISKAVLDRLLKQNIYFHIKIKKDATCIDLTTILYERGKPADFFIMILEGKVQAEIGKENLIFESGPFTFFGTRALIPLPGESTVVAPALSRKTSQCSFSEAAMQPTFVPDYTLKAVTDTTYFQISRSMYVAAKQATLLERSLAATENALSEEKIDEHLQNHLEQVAEGADAKPKETSITVAKSTGRGSISEKHLEGSREMNLLMDPPIQLQTCIIGNNNNVCKRNESGDVVGCEGEKFARNLSSVILCPCHNSEKICSQDDLLHEDVSFPGIIQPEVEDSHAVI